MSLHRTLVHWLPLANETSLPSDITDALVCFGVVFAVGQMLFTCFKPAPYGRFAGRSSRMLTWFNVDSRMAWTLQECPSFIIPFFLTVESIDRLKPTQFVLLAAFMVHYFHRSFIYSFFIRSHQTSFLPSLLAFLFCSFNGFLQTHTIIYSSQYGEREFLAPRFIFGLVLFTLGFLVNIDSDRRLRLLRGQRRKGDGYKIPVGGFFRYVSAANYFGEICEWAGFAVAARNPAATFFAFFTALFLGNRARQNHRFYLNMFEDYPKERKALIPFIW